MDRTPLREEFFDYVKTDPFTSAMVELLGRAYADGYDQALRDAVRALHPRHAYIDPVSAVQDLRAAQTHSDLVDAFIERQTRTAERAAAVLAMAEIARALPPTRFPL